MLISFNNNKKKIISTSYFTISHYKELKRIIAIKIRIETFK